MLTLAPFYGSSELRKFLRFTKDNTYIQYRKYTLT